MAPRIRARNGTLKRPQNLARGYFYPGEVVKILGLEGVDYRQLRVLFQLVREQTASPMPEERKWARFTFRDLVALKAAVRLAGGEEALVPGRRLRLRDVEYVCSRLREDFGLSQPLAEVAFRRRGKTIVAQVEGLLFEPASGQMLLAEVEEAVARYLEANPDRLEGRPGKELYRQLSLEVEEVKNSSRREPVALPRGEVSSC